MAASVRQLAAQVVERHELVVGRQRHLAADVHHALLPERVERELHRQDRPERVAVRVLVGDEEEALVRRGSRPRPRSAHRSLAPGSSISLLMRTPSSTVGSYSKASVGVRFILSSRARWDWSTPCAAASPSSDCSRFLLRPEHADKDARVPQVGGSLDPGHRHEPDARVLQLRKRLRQDLAHGLVHPAHPVAHRLSLPARIARRSNPRARRSAARSVRRPSPGRAASGRRRRAARAARPSRGRRTRVRAASAARDRGGRPRPPRRRSAAGAAPSPT